jgi:translation elongation factor EF-Tu-like GTPase
VSRWNHIEGQGAICFGSDGRVRIVVNDEVAEVFERAERDGVTADELVTRILDEAERKPNLMVPLRAPARESAYEGRCCAKPECRAYTYS